MVGGLVILGVLLVAVVAVLLWGSGRNRTPDTLGRDVMPLRPLDWFDVPAPANRAARRSGGRDGRR